MRLLVADIDLARLRSNVDAIKKIVETDFCAVVKADAYGHGLTMASKALEEKADEFAVATFDEALTLCEAGISKPIIILGCSDSDIFRNFSENKRIMPNIIPTVSDISEIKALKGIVKSVNVKLNTGMNRLGVSAENLDELVFKLTENGIGIKSIFTHLYKGDDAIESEKQFSVFEKATAKYSESGIKRHCCASCCLSLSEKFRCDAVRVGIAMYGYSDVTEPVMSVYTNILQVLNVCKGEHISYGDYVAPRDMRVAAIRAGYADGYRRKNGKDRFVAIGGRLCEVVGQICMDITLVDVTGVKLSGNDRVYLLGGGISGEMLAASCDTIVYEILTSFKGRIKRNYIG